MKRLIVVTLLACMAFAAFALAGTMPMESLPENMRVIADGSYPMDCKPLGDGGFLLSGLCGEPMEGSIESYLYSQESPDEEALASARPLSGYVAAYDTSGTQRWVYRLPESTPYQAIFTQPLKDGSVLCRVMEYTRYPVNYIQWDQTVDTFLLDDTGQYVKQLSWLTVLSNEGPRSFLTEWVHLLPNGILAIEPLKEFDLPYTPTLTMYDIDGNTQWQVSHKALTSYDTLRFSSDEDSYVSYAVYSSADGTPSGEPFETCLYKLGRQGQLLWQRKKFEAEFPGKLTVLRDGSMVGSATSYVLKQDEEQSTDSSILYGYDSEGNTLWRADDSIHGLAYISRIFEAADGKLYVSGWIRSDSGEYHNAVVAITSEGVSTGHVRLFGKAGRRTFADVIIESSDGLFVVGTIEEKGGNDQWCILRLEDSF